MSGESAGAGDSTTITRYRKIDIDHLTLPDTELTLSSSDEKFLLLGNPLSNGAFGAAYRVIPQTTTSGTSSPSSYVLKILFANTLKEKKYVEPELENPKKCQSNTRALLINFEKELLAGVLMPDFGISVSRFLRHISCDTHLNKRTKKEIALQVIMKSADAYQKFHEKTGFTHHDIHDSNILINPDGFNVIDFGLAKNIADPAEKRIAVQNDLAYIALSVLKNPQYRKDYTSYLRKALPSKMSYSEMPSIERCIAYRLKTYDLELFIMVIESFLRTIEDEQDRNILSALAIGAINHSFNSAKDIIDRIEGAKIAKGSLLPITKEELKPRTEISAGYSSGSSQEESSSGLSQEESSSKTTSSACSDYEETPSSVRDRSHYATWHPSAIPSINQEQAPTGIRAPSDAVKSHASSISSHNQEAPPGDIGAPADAVKSHASSTSSDNQEATPSDISPSHEDEGTGIQHKMILAFTEAASLSVVTEAEKSDYIVPNITRESQYHEALCHFDVDPATEHKEDIYSGAGAGAGSSC